MKIDFIKPFELDTSNPGTWPVYYQVLVWIVITVIAVFLVKKLVLDDKLSMIETNNNKITQIKENYKNNYHYVLELSAYKTRRDGLQVILSQLLHYLPTKQETAKVVDNVKVAASENKISISSWIPMNGVKMQYYDIEPIKLIAQTEFQNFAHFVESVANLEQVMNVSNFNLKSNNTDSTSERNLLNIDTELRTYIFNQIIEIDHEK